MASNSPSYDDYVSFIPVANRPMLEKKVDYQHNNVDKHLYDIAAVLYKWKDLITILNLTEADRIDAAHNSTPGEQRKGILQRWKQKFGHKATYGALLKACSDGRCVSAAEKIVTLLGGNVDQGDAVPTGNTPQRIEEDSAQAEKPKYSEKDQSDLYLKYKPENLPTNDERIEELNTFCKDVVFILQTVNENEFEAALTYMKPPSGNFTKAVVYPMTTMVVGMFANKKVALIRTEPGEKVEEYIEDAIEAYPNASYVFGVGVCYAFKPDKVKLGDVLISKKINDNVNMKATPSGDFEYRGQSVDVIQQLTKIFCLGSKHTEYHDIVLNSDRESHAYSGTFCCDTVLVNNKDLREKYLKASSTAIGGEMEGGKLLKFVQSKRRKLEGVIVIKGVADYADGEKSKEWQFTAAMAAFYYTNSQLCNVLLKELLPPGKGEANHED